jgi:hypothetical protein
MVSLFVGLCLLALESIMTTSKAVYARENTMLADRPATNGYQVTTAVPMEIPVFEHLQCDSAGKWMAAFGRPLRW